MEGNFEDSSLKMKDFRSDFIYKHNYQYFKNSKHKTINEFANLVYHFPFELNKKFPEFQLQTNDYIQASFFRENHSCLNRIYDSSFKEGHDSGKKLTLLFVLFPEKLELSKRNLYIKLTNQNDKDDCHRIELTKPLSILLFKSRKYLYEIEQQSFPFILIFYYIHGPVDKLNNTC
jgi:hypothetical protein